MKPYPTYVANAGCYSTVVWGLGLKVVLSGRMFDITLTGRANAIEPLRGHSR